MPLIQLEAFKASIAGIARPNRFYIQFTGDPVNLNEFDYYLVKGAALPGKSLGEIDLNWMGYKYKVAGDPTFDDITLTFYNDIPYPGMTPVRTKFIDWMNYISNDSGNTRAAPLLYKCSLHVYQLDGQGLVAQHYELVDAHPKNLSDIELSMDNTDQVEEFTVTFSYSYFKTGSSLGSTLLSAGTQILGRFL